ncbi:MAG: hypothetical protein KJZ59_09895 [Pararhodobacter sp.]|nr:hypothetical protein [Pararhodobacter sp.]
MQTKAQSRDSIFPISVDRVLMDAQTVLVIDAPAALRSLSPRPGRQSVIVTQKRMLGAAMIRAVRPDAIIGPLITAHWDIVDLGIELEQLGYRGDLFALTLPLPRAELVIREVSAVCPALNVRLLEVA